MMMEVSMPSYKRRWKHRVRHCSVVFPEKAKATEGTRFSPPGKAWPRPAPSRVDIQMAHTGYIRIYTTCCVNDSFMASACPSDFSHSSVVVRSSSSLSSRSARNRPPKQIEAFASYFVVQYTSGLDTCRASSNYLFGICIYTWTEIPIRHCL